MSGAGAGALGPRQRRPIHSAIARVSADQISVHGVDLVSGLMGNVNLGDMAFLEVTGRLPSRSESVVFNAILVSLVEHGLTPSAMVARLTFLGAPEALQAAVAAGLLGLGSKFGGTMEEVAAMLQQALPLDAADEDLEQVAADTIQGLQASGRTVPGLGHRSHKDGDPRATRLFALAEEAGLAGRYVTLMRLIHRESERRFERQLPLNATGAIGALACDLRMPWRIVRGFGVMARAIGLVGHVLEEINNPIANEINMRTQEEAAAESANNPSIGGLAHSTKATNR